MRQGLAILMGLLLLGQTVAAWAEPASHESMPEQVALGAGSVLGTLVYAPVKGVFCILGAVSSGFAYPIAGSKTAEHIATTTCGGNWYVTPSNLQGREPIRFVGNSS